MFEGQSLPAIPTTRRLLGLIDAMAGRPVVVAADLVVDRFITGVPGRISREAPVLILSQVEERLTPGGGANAVANVAALGGRPLPLGVVGDDAQGHSLLSLLKERDIDVDGIRVRRGYRTPTKTRVLGGARNAIKQQIVRYDIEDRLELTADERDHHRRCVAGWAKAASLRVGVVSDYGYGGADGATVAELRRQLGAEALLLGDSRYRLPELPGLDAVTPNQEEAEALLGGPLGESTAEVEVSGRRLRQELRVAFLLVTRGSRGMSLIDEDRCHHLPVHGTDQVADVTGAGDTVIGTAALALAAGATPLEAAVLANYAGGVVVMKMGTATASADELKEAVTADPPLVAGLEPGKGC